MTRDRELKMEERILWGKVAKTTRPMPGRMEDLLAFEDPETPAPPETAPAIVSTAAFAGGPEARTQTLSLIHI